MPVAEIAIAVEVDLGTKTLIEEMLSLNPGGRLLYWSPLRMQK